MVKAMVRRAIADRIPFRWVTADAAYGFSKGWRSELKRAHVFHVMATTRHDTVVTRWAIGHPVHDLPGRNESAVPAAPGLTASGSTTGHASTSDRGTDPTAATG